MTVKCLWNDKRERELSVGKDYVVLDKTNLMYVIKSDKGAIITTLKERFEISK